MKDNMYKVVATKDGEVNTHYYSTKKQAIGAANSISDLLSYNAEIFNEEGKSII